MRESCLTIWRADSHQALRMCEDRQVEVDATEVSNVSWDPVDDPWASSLRASTSQIGHSLRSPAQLHRNFRVVPLVRVLDLSRDCQSTPGRLLR